MAYNDQKTEEIQFYIDRVIDSAAMIMRSIVHNPRLSADDQVHAIKRIADLHGSISLDLQRSIHGQEVSLSLKSDNP